jgi:2-keto-4-pentenoate hydratase/2-oxohepta-3-ene-1,7-dioic acid hydratase in catechol pathway
MKIVTFTQSNTDDSYRIGSLVSGTEILDLTHLVSGSSLSRTEVLKCFDLDQGFCDEARSVVESGKFPIVNLKDISLAAPVPRPGKIICIGLNYRDHAAESGMPIPTSPIIFSKFNSCAIGPAASIVIPPGSTQPDYEAELAFIMGRHTRNVARENALDHVFGYTNFNDVTARDFQFADGQWQRGKSCETFAPMGQFVATTDEIPDPQKLWIKLRLNGETMQDSSTDQMIFGVAELVEFLSRYITLEPGDVVATGTPPGVGFARKPPVYLKDGDVVEVEIEGLGVLSNPVIAQNHVR